MTAIREALTAFGRQIRGFDMDDAVLTGVETRTSSPVRVPRGADFQSINTKGLYPGGEGAGYAGRESFPPAWTASSLPKPWRAISSGQVPVNRLVFPVVITGSFEISLHDTCDNPMPTHASGLGYIKLRNYRPLRSGQARAGGHNALSI